MINIFYIVATPIGNLSDISHRAIDILHAVDLILAEDTRHSRKLLQHYGIKTKVITLHEHNEDSKLEFILSELAEKSIALISDAGTPLISDPGFKLVSFLRNHNQTVVPIPGACALIAGLSAAGLATDSFLFKGFVPSSEKARLTFLTNLVTVTSTLIFYESPKRIMKTIKEMINVFGTKRICSISRELTKLNEQIVTKNLLDIFYDIESGIINQRGEFVIILSGADKVIAADELEVRRVLQILQADLTNKNAVKLASQITKMSKNEVYKIALQLND